MEIDHLPAMTSHREVKGSKSAPAKETHRAGTSQQKEWPMQDRTVSDLPGGGKPPTQGGITLLERQILGAIGRKMIANAHDPEIDVWSIVWTAMDDLEGLRARLKRAQK